MFSNIQTMLNVARIITVVLVLIASAMCEPIEKFEITFGSDFNASSVNINNDNCTCTPFHLCADDPMNTDGAGLMDIRILDESSCPGDFEVCCKSPASDNEPDDDEPSEKLEGCGYQHSKSGFFPWSSALMYRDFRKTSNSYKCGVSLIQESAVITAAHCLKEQGGYYSVRIGREVRNASKIIVHPEYSSATLHNDIALIILNAPIRNAGKSGTICIPPKGTVLDYSDCKSVTWVKQSMKNTTYSYLKMLNLPILPRKTCLNLLRKTVLGPLFKLHYGFVCAGGHAGEDTCGGDGGTPLICPVPGQPHRFHQAGIVSWGIGCSEGQVPGVYTKLSAFRDWIDSEMLTNELDIISYRY